MKSSSPKRGSLIAGIKCKLVFLLLIISQSVSAQEFPGFRTGNYTGVNGVFFNPANIADSRYRWDFNLLSISTSVGNDQASFKLKNLGDILSGDSLMSQFINDNAPASSANVNMNIQGPSLFFNAGKKSAFAFTTRTRVMVNAIDIDGKLIGEIRDGSKSDLKLPYNINSSENMQAIANGWSEFGVSYGRVLKEEGRHFLKGGISLKYLAGVVNGDASLNQLKATINEDINGDSYIQNSTGRMKLDFGGINIDDVSVGELTSFKSTGFGADIGFVYEFRPDYEKYKLDSNSWRRDLNKYKFRLGIALLDIGSNKYERDMKRSGTYDISITGSEKLYLSELDGLGVDSLKPYFDQHPQFFTPVAGNNESSYKVGLPTTLQIDADYHFHDGFYVSLAGQISLVNSKNKPYNSQYYSGISLTPRYEGRHFGFYLPLNYNQLTSFNAGVSLRVGMVFIGSGSALTAVFGSSKQADWYFGARFGGLQKHKEKKTHSQ